MTRPDLSIVIVGYNTASVLEPCLKSVFEHSRDLSLEVFVVDNASSDGGAEMVRTRFPQVKLIANSENLYFTRASNQGLRQAEGRYRMILNPDTFLRDNAFKKLVDFMDAHPEAGACGPRFLNADGTLQGIGHRYPDLLYGLFEFCFLNALFPGNPVRRRRICADLDPERTQEIEATGGSCMLVRAETAQTVGLLDEGFLMYSEETDWCRRIRQSGAKIFAVVEAQVYHHGARSTSQVKPKKIEAIFRRSLLRFYRKRYGLAVYAVFACLSFVQFQVLNVYRGLKRRGEA